MPTRAQIIHDFLDRLKRTRRHMGAAMVSGWNADHASLEVRGEPLLSEHVRQQLNEFPIDPARFDEAMKDVPDARLTEDRMANVVRRQVQRHLVEWLVSEGNDPQHVDQAVRAYVSSFRVASEKELSVFAE